MVSTSSPFADLGSATAQNEAPEEDFYLHMNLPPELDLPLPATTQIYRKPPRSYLIPRWDLKNGAFTRLEFPEKSSQEDVETFEVIMAQCTAFIEHQPYNPADWATGASMGGGKTRSGQIVLVDEENGSIVGELGEGADIVEDSTLAHGTKSMYIRAD